MNLSIYNRKLVEEISKALNSQKPHTSVMIFFNDFGFGQDSDIAILGRSFDNIADGIGPEYENNSTLNLLANALKSLNELPHSANHASKSVEKFGTERLKLLLLLSAFPFLRYKRPETGDLFIYNDGAHSFVHHRLSNFGAMNDPYEVVTLYNSLGSTEKTLFVDATNQILKNRCDGNILISCTTILDNSNYFKEQYSKNGKYVGFDKETVIKNHERLYVYRKFIPINGFVRYGSVGKSGYLELIVKLRRKGLITSYLAKEIFKIFSLFVKEDVMSVEKEYRFILLQEKPSVNSIDISPMAGFIKKTVINPDAITPGERDAMDYYASVPTSKVCSI